MLGDTYNAKKHASIIYLGLQLTALVEITLKLVQSAPQSHIAKFLSSALLLRHKEEGTGKLPIPCDLSPIKVRPH